MRMFRLSLALALLVGSMGALAAAPPEVSGCTKCHGDNGISKSDDSPIIAGMSAAYFEAQMSAYQKGQRPCPKLTDPKKSDTDMCEVAKKLAAAGQVKSVADYYASQKFVAATQAIDAGLAAKGKALHDAKCEVCHSDGGSEAADDAGILAGQWKAYLQATLQDYLTGKRAAPEKMKHQMTTLTPDNVQALAAYYASEHAK